MPIEVTRDWRQSRFTRGRDAYEAYIVTGCSTPGQAELAVGANGQSVPRQNSGYPDDARLLAQAPSTTTLGLNIFSVGLTWVRPGNGNGDKETDNPLDKKAVYRIEPGGTTEPIAYDADGHPLLNSALDPLDPPPTDDFPIKFVTIRRNVSTFDLVRAMAYENKVNSDVFTLPKIGPVAIGLARVVDISPGDEFTEDAEYIEEVTRLELRIAKVPGLYGDATQDTFDHLLLDVGLNGWWNDSGTLRRGRFCNLLGQEMNTPVRLDGHGKPMDTSIKVKGGEGREPQAPVAAPRFPAGGFNVPVADGTLLRYKKKKSISFNGLTLR
jgi:hypothetical protein